jgi:hypothetical protein
MIQITSSSLLLLYDPDYGFLIIITIVWSGIRIPHYCCCMIQITAPPIIAIFMIRITASSLLLLYDPDYRSHIITVLDPDYLSPIITVVKSGLRLSLTWLMMWA